MSETLIILNIAAPYRVDFLNDLSQHENIKVVFEQSSTARREKIWLANDKVKFKHYYIDKKISRIFKTLLDIFKHKNIILGGYATPLSILFIIWMKILGKKYVLNADGGFIKKERKIVTKIKKKLISSATYWLSTGKETNKYLEYYGAESKNIYTYPFSSVENNEIELISHEEKGRLKKQLNFKNSQNVLYVGSFTKRKNVELLIRAARNIEDIGFYFIGGVPSGEYLNLADNKDNINFINHLSKEELQKYYKAVDLFVFPTREDIWGLVINEAMSYGLPIITTDRCIAGLEMITSAQYGKIIPVNSSSKQLAKEIEQSFLNYEIFDRNMIIKKANDYTIETMVDAHLKIFKDIFS